MEVLASLATLLVACTATEYAVHRWFMHRRTSAFFLSHTVEHHGFGLTREPRHMDLTFRQGLAFFVGWLPVHLLLAAFVWRWHLAAALLVACWWPFAWSATHRLIHGDRRYAYARVLVPWYPLVERHHLRHHERWTRNYAAIFFWGDWLMGTRA